jgi:serine/threonine-protein kinase
VEALEAYTKALLVASANAEALDGKARIEKLLPKDAAYVPAGKFLFGEEKAERELPAFWIQKREVTCDEYAAFLASMKEAGKEVAAPRSWSGGKVPEGAGGLPVRGVPFADASEYARWKGSGWRLPSEEEWEKAARGTDGRLYPWGDEFAAGNANVARYAQAPLPPGSVPGDSSPCGCLDMAGNVMEWTTTDYDAAKPIYKGVKTLKGGRYDSSERAAQAASRAPGSGADGLEAGFRLVWAP